MLFHPVSIAPTAENQVKINSMQGIDQSREIDKPPLSAAKPPEFSLPEKNKPSAPPESNLQNYAAKAIQSAWRGYAVRKHVSVSSLGLGMVKTAINKPAELAYQMDLSGSAIKDIQEQMQSGATYTRLSIRKGSLSANVIGTGKSEQAKQPSEILMAHKVPGNTAFINGGFFVHKEGLVDDQDQPIRTLGRPIGKTLTRADNVDIPEPWKKDYGYISVNREVGINCGPLLSLNGKKLKDINNDKRFQYRIPTANGELIENPLNKRIGALTHASDNNERAAISIGSNDKLSMHTLTAEGKRSKGVSMDKWQAIVHTADPDNISSLNLDGGDSVFMGLIDANKKISPLARGGNPSSTARPLANMVIAKTQEL